MSNISPSKPSFVFGYWRPWKENSNVIDSYLDYVKDTSLVKYGADTVGTYINQASQEQIQAINKLGVSIGRGINILSEKMTEINSNLFLLNRNFEIQIQQQKLTNLLLENIDELLKIPDSEKERQLFIERGLQYFVNASKNKDLYSDALKYFLKAEEIFEEDYFVLHIVGYIYLFVLEHIDPEKALNYFDRAAKYSSIESDKDMIRLQNILANNVNSMNSTKKIGLLASDSYEKAAFAAYILGRIDTAVDYQNKSLKLNNSNYNRFLLGKYQCRKGDIKKAVINIEKCIDNEPNYVLAVFKEIDLVNESAVIEMITNKNDEIDLKINQLSKKIEVSDAKKLKSNIKKLNELLNKPYELKVAEYVTYERELSNATDDITNKIHEIDMLINEIDESIFLTYDIKKLETVKKELIDAKKCTFEEMSSIYEKLKKVLYSDKLSIGSRYAGGIVFYLDDTAKHGLVCAEADFGKACWGGNGKLTLKRDNVSNSIGIENTNRIVEQFSSYIEHGFFSTKTKPFPTAARLCKESNDGGFNDWYLPTIKELKLIHENLAFSKTVNFKKGDIYWSCLDCSDELAQGFDVKYGYSSNYLKNEMNFVLAVRAF